MHTPSPAFTPLDQRRPTDLISGEKLRQLYTAMLRLRLSIDHSARISSRRSTKVDWQEASMVGCAIDLGSEDSVVVRDNQKLDAIWNVALPSANRTDGDPARSGLRPPAMIKLEHSPARIAWATGIAVLHRTQAKGNIALVFTAPDEIGSSRESLQFAHEHCLPIIYVQLERESGSNWTRRPTRRTQQITAIPVDKTDVVAVYRVASEAIDKARRGAGPTLIQCLSYLQRGQRAVPDGHSSDPILYMEYYLRRKTLWSAELESE